MRIGISTRAMDESPTGVGIYVFNLIKELISLSRHNYTLIHFKKSESELYKMADEVIVPNIPAIPDAAKTSIYLSLKGKDFDLVHETSNIGLLFPAPFKRVLTIHDLRSYLFPKKVPYRRAIKLKLGRYLLRPYNGIDKIITVSQASKKDIIRELKIPEEKVKVIYNGVDERFRMLKDKDRLGEKLREKYSINQDFILNVTTLHPLKNIPSMIRAYYKLKKKYNLEKKLVIVGGTGWKYSDVYKIVNELNLKKDIIFTGYIPYEELPIFYNIADLFVFPSIYEGFGIPVLEAMACGCPVVSSNMFSLPEVVGDAGIMVNPYDIDGLTKAMHEVLNNDGLREYMIKKGLERAKMFTWKKCAKEVLEVYEEVIAGR